MPKSMGFVAAVGLFLTSTAAIPVTQIAMPRPASAREDHGNFSAGRPGDPKKPGRVVKIKMFEGSGKMGYEPARIEVRRGEQIRFVLQNDGEEDHEFILATARKHAEIMKKIPKWSTTIQTENAFCRTGTASLEVHEAWHIRVRLSHSWSL